MKNIDPAFFGTMGTPGNSAQLSYPNLMDTVSGEFSDLKLNQSSKSHPKTGGQLDTPDVSMEQNKSRNNLDQ